MRTVYIVIDPELGWDNVVGIFDTEVFSPEEMREVFPSDQYLLKEVEVEVSLLPRMLADEE
jgi:hypothetical protein